jgi:hypothetical protein
MLVWMPLSCIVTFVSVSHYLSALSLSHSERERAAWPLYYSDLVAAVAEE